MISGVVTEPVTPQKGKEMSDSIKRKYFHNRRQNGQKLMSNTGKI